MCQENKWFLARETAPFILLSIYNMGWKRNQGGKLRSEESVINSVSQREPDCVLTFVQVGALLLPFCILDSVHPVHRAPSHHLCPSSGYLPLGHNSHASPFLELFSSHSRTDFPFIVLLSIYFYVSFCTDCMLSSITFVCIYFISLQTYFQGHFSLPYRKYGFFPFELSENLRGLVNLTSFGTTRQYQYSKIQRDT